MSFAGAFFNSLSECALPWTPKKSNVIEEFVVVMVAFQTT